MGGLLSTFNKDGDVHAYFDDLVQSAMEPTNKQSLVVPVFIDDVEYDNVALHDTDACKFCNIWRAAYINIPCGCKTICKSCLQSQSEHAHTQLTKCTMCSKPVKEIK